MITNYSELKTAISNWLEDDSLDSRIPEFIAIAEDRISDELVSRGVEKTDTSITTVSGTSSYTLPADLLEARHVFVDSNPVRLLSYRSSEQALREFPNKTVGRSSVYTIDGDVIELFPAPNSADTLKIKYIFKLSPLSDSNATNWLTDNAPALLLYGSLIEAEMYLVDDPRVPTWKTLFQEKLDKLNIRERRARHSGSTLVMRTRAGNP